VPRAQWRDTDLEQFAGPILDQDGLNACTAAAACTALQIARVRDGLNAVHLAMGPLYGQICGGQDGGAPIDDALNALEFTGTLAARDCEELEWRIEKLRADWRTRAADFRISEAFDLSDVDEIGSALELGDPVVCGIPWGRGAHAICICGKKQTADGWLWHFPNTWGEGWGEAGFAWLRERDIAPFQPFGAWAIRCATVAYDDPVPPRPHG